MRQCPPSNAMLPCQLMHLHAGYQFKTHPVRISASPPLGFLSSPTCSCAHHTSSSSAVASKATRPMVWACLNRCPFSHLPHPGPPSLTMKSPEAPALTPCSLQSICWHGSQAGTTCLPGHSPSTPSPSKAPTYTQVCSMSVKGSHTMQIICLTTSLPPSSLPPPPCDTSHLPAYLQRLC